MRTKKREMFVAAVLLALTTSSGTSPAQQAYIRGDKAGQAIVFPVFDKCWLVTPWHVLSSRELSDSLHTVINVTVNTKGFSASPPAGRVWLDDKVDLAALVLNQCPRASEKPIPESP